MKNGRDGTEEMDNEGMGCVGQSVRNRKHEEMDSDGMEMERQEE